MTLNKSNEKQSNIPLYKHSFHLGHLVRITEIKQHHRHVTIWSTQTDIIRRSLVYTVVA